MTLMLGVTSEVKQVCCPTFSINAYIYTDLSKSTSKNRPSL